MQQILLPDVFVYGVAQTLAACLGREGQAAFARLLNAMHYIDRKVIGTQRRKRYSDAARLAVFKQLIAQVGQMTIIARAE